METAVSWTGSHFQSRGCTPTHGSGLYPRLEREPVCNHDTPCQCEKRREQLRCCAKCLVQRALFSCRRRISDRRPLSGRPTACVAQNSDHQEETLLVSQS